MKYRLTIAVPLAMLGTLAFVSPVGAQRGIGAKPAPIGHAAVRGTFASSGRSAYRYAHPSRPIYRRGNGWGIGPGWGWGALPYPDYGDYSDYPSPIKEPAPPMVMEPPQPARVIQPILIERHGDQWVESRVTVNRLVPRKLNRRKHREPLLCAPPRPPPANSPHLLTRYPRRFWCSATGMRKRSRVTPSSAAPCMRKQTTGPSVHGPER